MPWLSVNHTRLAAPSAVPTPLFALDVQRAEWPGQPGAKGVLPSGAREARLFGIMRVLVIDVGGTHVKVLATGRKQPIKIPSGPELTPKEMVRQVRKAVAAAGWPYDAVSIGFPAPVVHGRPVSEPHNLG